MKKLILIRHSDAESGSFNTPDFERRLTPQGKNKANLQANRLKNKSLIPDLILTSSASRAEETSKIFSSVLSARCPIQKVPFLYEDYTTSDFLKLINGINDSLNIVFVIGHNPNITIMASRLDTDSLISFQPCSVGIFDVTDHWSKVEVDNGKMIDFIPG